MVSIIPGMETRAPERTETNRGRSTEPNFRAIASSTWPTLLLILSASPSGNWLVRLK